MSHHIYHTRGIILGSSAVGESNRFYKIFTEELGLVGASAQSVREGKSKLRYTLQDFSFVTVDLVRGKEVWRIVSAGGDKPRRAIKDDEARLKLFARFSAFLLRLLQGEGRDQELFDEILRIADFLEKETVTQKLAISFEALVALRVLVHLGYIDPAGFENYLGVDAYSLGVLDQFEKVRPIVLPKINDALNASHL